VSLSTDDNLPQAMILLQRIKKWEDLNKPVMLTNNPPEAEQLLSEVR